MPAATSDRAQDNQFWSGGFKLEGSWPTAWKHGVQYDLNTVRANIRPARGVFKHPCARLANFCLNAVARPTQCQRDRVSPIAAAALTRCLCRGCNADPQSTHCGRDQGSQGTDAPQWKSPPYLLLISHYSNISLSSQ